MAPVFRRSVRLALGFLLAVGTLTAQTPPRTPYETPDIGKAYEAPRAGDDYERREVKIPMRDGVSLFTVIVVPKGATRAPMLLTRTPYNAGRRTERNDSPSVLATLPQGDGVFVADGYIRVFQDVRGKYGSEGDYVLTRPLRGPLNPTATDHSTDAYDTIEWLVKHVPESNGRVGMLGSSYEGFTVVMALVHPHPALKVAAPMSPMVDGWMGDDWFHYGAFRLPGLDFIAGQTSVRGAGSGIRRDVYDDYQFYLRYGSTGAFVKAHGLDQFVAWKKMSEHPAYDAFWQGQDLVRVMAAQPLTVPTMWIQGLWDQEDMWGAIQTWLKVEPKDRTNDRNYLVMGPWRHSQVNYDGATLGPLHWEGDTALQFRRDVLKPFFDQYLKDGAPRAQTPPVFIYNTGENHWDRLERWPLACASGCAAPMKPLYFTKDFGLSFTAPAAAAGPAAYDEYVSDPAKPVPYVPRPVRFADGATWRTWLVMDQRAVADRPDVLVYQSPVLTEPLRISGAPVASLIASTSGTDSDWVVKLIDVYPDEVVNRPEMGGYQLSVSMDIFRGRYRESFETPAALAANVPLAYRFVLPTTNHVFLPGHRVMVQIQSSWFPLYDRNPQTFVPNIFFAEPKDYVKATQRVYRAGATASAIELPLVPAATTRAGSPSAQP
jgi:putative CocE/NonD family hydrolase